MKGSVRIFLVSLLVWFNSFHVQYGFVFCVDKYYPVNPAPTQPASTTTPTASSTYTMPEDPENTEDSEGSEDPEDFK